MKVTLILIIIGALGMVLKNLVRGTGRIGSQRMNRDHPNYCIAKIAQNTEKSPEDLRIFAVYLTPVKDY